jgi:hypothetical protein
MQRKVAKAKDGNVGKNNKGDGKVVVGKRSRKMRGGGENFKQYCERFVLDNKREFDEAKTRIIKNFIILNTIIGAFTPKFKYQIGDSDEKKDKKSALSKIGKILIKKDTKYIIDAIDNDELKNLLAYISTNEEKIKDKIGEDKDEDIIDKIGEDKDEDIIDKLCKDILFIKIYKLFTEFLDISISVTKIFSIQIATEKTSKNDEEKTKQTIEMLKDTPRMQTTFLDAGWSKNVDTRSLQQTDPQQESQTSLLLTTDDVNKDSNRSETNRRKSSIYVSKSKPVLHLQGTREPAKNLDMTKDKGVLTTIAEQKAALTEPIIYDKETTIREFTNIRYLLTNTPQYKRIVSYYDSLSKENINENDVRTIIANIFWKTYDNVIKYFEGEHNIDKIHPFILDLSIKNVEKNHKSNIDTIKSLSAIDDTKKDEMIQYVTDAKNLSLTYNEMYKKILEKYLGYLVSNSISDEESGEDDNLVEEAKKTLMMLINDNTKKATDDSIYKKYEKIKDDLDEKDEFENYIKIVLKDLLFQKINDILDLLDSRDHTKEKIEDFLLRVEDDIIRKEIEEYKQTINQKFSTINAREKNSKMELIVNAKNELIRLFSIFRPEIKNYIQLLDSQTEPDDTNGSQDPPTLFGIHDALNSPPNSSSIFPPLKGADSSFSSKLVINGSNKTKIAVSEKLKERYEKDMLEINNILREKDTYLDQQKIKERVIVLFKNIIIMAFKILNFKKINEIGKDLSILENYITTSSNLIFSNMNIHVRQHYSNFETEHYTIIKTTNKINLLQVLFNNFQFFCYDKLNMQYRNNETDKIWEAEGGQPQKQPTAKEPKPKEPKPKEPTKTPKAKEPSAKVPTKTPKPKEPTKK